MKGRPENVRSCPTLDTRENREIFAGPARCHAVDRRNDIRVLPTTKRSLGPGPPVNDVWEPGVLRGPSTQSDRVGKMSCSSPRQALRW
jgi:hypothetical protein